MTRPCHCNKFAGGAFVAGRDCSLCWLWNNNAAVRTAWQTNTPVEQPPAGGNDGPKPCIYRGDDLTHAEREVLGVGHTRRYALCLNPDHGEYQKPVCPCTGCGTKCPGYVASKLEVEQ